MMTIKVCCCYGAGDRIEPSQRCCCWVLLGFKENHANVVAGVVDDDEVDDNIVVVVVVVIIKLLGL